MKKLILKILMMGMLFFVAGCSSSFGKNDFDAKPIYYNLEANENNPYFDVQKFLHDKDREFIKEQKSWLLLYQISTIILFPYDCLRFEPIIHSTPVIP